MIEKNLLLSMIKEALISEEEAIPVYMKHLESAVFWTGISKDKADKIREGLELLSRETKMHKRMLEMIMEKVQEKES